MGYGNSVSKIAAATKDSRPPSDHIQRKPALNRSRAEDLTAHHGTTSNRPTLLETRHSNRGSSNGMSDLYNYQDLC